MKSWDQLKWLRINIIKQFYSKFFNQLLFNNYFPTLFTNKQKRKKNYRQFLLATLLKFQKSTFWIFFLKTGYQKPTPPSSTRKISKEPTAVTQLLVIIGAKRSGSRFARFCFARRRKYTQWGKSGTPVDQPKRKRTRGGRRKAGNSAWNWAFEESCESQPVLLLTLG